MGQQATVTLKHLKSRPWEERTFSIPEDVSGVTGMLTKSEKRMLYYLTRYYYSGQGAILDMGAFLGGSTICFAAAASERGLSGPVIHSYDLFRLGNFEREQFFATDPPPDMRTRSIFDRNLSGFDSVLCVHEGDVLSHRWHGGAIELLFVDIAKSYRVFDHIVTEYFPHLIPTQSLVILQDYILASGPWHHVVMEKLHDYFDFVVDTHVNSAVFVLTKPIPSAVLDGCRWSEISQEEKLSLMDAAIARLDTEQKRNAVLGARLLLIDGRHLTWGLHYHRLGERSGGDS